MGWPAAPAPPITI